MSKSEERLNLYTEFFSGDHGEASAKRNRDVYLQPFEDWVAGEDITGEVLARWRISLDHPQQKLIKRGRPTVSLSASYKNRKLGAVKAYLNWLRSIGKLSIDKDTIYDVLKNYKRGSGGLPRVLYREEIQRLLDATCDYDEGSGNRRPVHRFIALGLLTFARRSEILNLRWRDVDFARQLVRIRGSKTGVWRELPFKHSSVLPDLLRQWKSWDVARDMWLDRFVARPWALKAPWANAWSTRFQAIVTLANIDNATPQIMRRTAISYLASARFYEQVHLNIMSGHSGLVSKKFYQHPIYEDLTGGDPEAKLEDFYGANFGRLLGLENVCNM